MKWCAKCQSGLPKEILQVPGILLMIKKCMVCGETLLDVPEEETDGNSSHKTVDELLNSSRNPRSTGLRHKFSANAVA